MYNPKLSPIPQSEDDEEETYDDAISDISTSTWKSGTSEKSYYSTAGSQASLNNNHPQTRPTTSHTIPHHHHHSICHRHVHGHHNCSCIKTFYEEDELCRINTEGHLEFGIVSKLNKELKILWTLGNKIEEQNVNSTDDHEHENLRLIDRRSVPGDIIQVNKKRGEVLEVSWTCHAIILENNMCVLNIQCDNLEPLIPYYPGQKLEYESGWIGTITNVNTEATLMFTGETRTGVIDCSTLPCNQQPYPGRKVRYTINQYVEAKLRFLDDNRTVSQVFRGQLVVEAFVLFLNVTDVQVKWNGRIKASSTGPGRSSSEVTTTSQPPTTLSKSHLKRHTKVLGTIKDVDWESCHDPGEKYFQYTVKDTDVVVTDIEEYIKSRYFEEKHEHVCTVKELRDNGNNKICNNVGYNVKVIRFCRNLKVKWSASGKIESIPSSSITSKKSFPHPHHQIVQRSLPLSNYTYDEFGITLSRSPNDTVLVQWITKSRENSKFTFNPSYQTPEPLYNLEPHFAYGSISPRQIVFRSVYCRLIEPLFTLGWVRSVTQNGTVIVVSAHSKQEHALYPLELESTGIKLDSTEHQSKFKLSKYNDLVRIHSLEVLRKADKIFMQNLSVQEMSSSFPEHFQLLQKCPTTHTFYKNVFSVRSDGSWMRAVKKDQLYLTTKMNEEIGSIWVKGFRDRLDLFSVLMAAPPGTPYEGALYHLDLQLIQTYPSHPPSVFFHTSCGNLTPGTKLLELQDNVMPPHSLVESLIALQNKLFTSTTEFQIPSSAASLQRRNITTKDHEERQQNANTIIDVLDLTYRQVMDPPKLWTTEVINYFHMTFERNKERLLGLIDVTNPYSNCSDDWIIPTFPLMPVTDGFIEAVLGRLKRFEELIDKSIM